MSSARLSPEAQGFADASSVLKDMEVGGFDFDSVAADQGDHTAPLVGLDLDSAFKFDGETGETELVTSDLMKKLGTRDDYDFRDPTSPHIGSFPDPASPHTGSCGCVSKSKAAILLTLLVHSSNCRKRNCDFSRCTEGRRLMQHVRSCTTPDW